MQRRPLAIVFSLSVRERIKCSSREGFCVERVELDTINQTHHAVVDLALEHIALAFQVLR
jgi:hypothetical protein